MSLLLLFHGAAAAPFTPKNEHYQQWSMGRIGRTVVLSVAAISTGWMPAMPPRVPEREFQEGWRSQFSIPVVLKKTLNAALLDSGFKPIMPPRIPNREFQDGWRSSFSTPSQHLVKVLSTAANSTGWMPAMPPRQPEVEFREGWRSKWQEPPAQLQAKRSVELLGDVQWPGVGYAAQVVQTPTDFDAFTWWQGPPHYLKAKGAPHLSLSGIAWTPLGPVSYGFSNQLHVYSPAKRAADLYDWTPWPAQVPTVATATPTDLWWPQWQNPVRLSPQRATNLLENWNWPGAGYAFFQVVAPPTDWWFERWQNPPYLLAAKRSVDLLGTAFNYAPRPWPFLPWFIQWEDPPAYNVDVEFIPVTDETGDPVLDENGNPILIEPFTFHIPQRCITLRVGWNWLPRVADREFQDGWRSSFSVPPQFSAARRATNLSESWPWPGYGYFFQAIVPPPSDWWYERWQNPPQLLQARRSQGLLGYTVTARVPEREFQEGWRSSFTVPARLFQPPRQPGYITFPGTAGIVVQVVYQEGWRSAFSQPSRIWQAPRQQGFISFAASQGLPITLSPGPWSPVPAGIFRAVRTRIVTAWPWQALQFTPPTATPSVWWRTQWTDPPKAPARAVYLRDDSWGSWAPQIIIQIVPTPPLVGVSFTFGIKTGPSAVAGTKPGATLQSQRKGGGFSLITRVKPRIS